MNQVVYVVSVFVYSTPQCPKAKTPLSDDLQTAAIRQPSLGATFQLGFGRSGAQISAGRASGRLDRKNSLVIIVVNQRWNLQEIHEAQKT